MLNNWKHKIHQCQQPISELIGKRRDENIVITKRIYFCRDKTRNIYEMDAKMCVKLSTENIVKNYKLGNNEIFENINHESKDITDELQTAD